MVVKSDMILDCGLRDWGYWFVPCFASVCFYVASPQHGHLHPVERTFRHLSAAMSGFMFPSTTPNPGDASPHLDPS